MDATTTSERVDPPVAPDMAFGSPDLSLWGTGEALRIAVPAPWPEHLDQVTAALGGLTAVAGDGTAGLPVRGPVAFGALPYDRDLPASFVVPARLVGRTSRGDSWTTVVGDAPDGSRTTADLPSDVEVRAVQDPEAWCDAVAAATKAIADGDFTKVVLARELLVQAGSPFDPAAVLARFAQAHPHALTYLVDGFVGASPELLVSRLGETVRAQPMAGTTPRTGDPEVDHRAAAELLASAKNRAEHQITIDMVHDALLTWCSYLDAEPTPSVVPAGPVQHLATMVEGRLSRPLPSVLEMVAALHPTPAVGGWPVAPALAAQRELEHLDRGRYAGPVGWVDAEGNGVMAVGIRGAELDGTRARVFAGVGVVADSDPAAELAETQAKFKAALSALVQP